MYRYLLCLFAAGMLLPLLAAAQEDDLALPHPSVVLDARQIAGLTALASPAELRQPEVAGYPAASPNQPRPKLTAAEASMYASEKRKTFDRTYKVSAADLLSIENKFGSVQVNTWPRKEIQVKVEIITRAGTDSKAQEVLDLINIAESREGKTIVLRTEITPTKIVQSNNKSFEINYMVYMPSENPIKLRNSFGDVYVAALKGKADLNVKYGSLKTESLSSTGNSVKVAYGGGSCGFINQGNIEVSYGNMQIEGANGLQGFSKFSDFKLGKLSDALNMEVKYGTFRVDNISKDIRKVNLEIGFTPVVLNFESKAAFSFDVNIKFGDFTYDKSLVTVTSLVKDPTSAAYKGRFGSSSPKGLVSIKSRFGDVAFSE